MNMPVLYQLEFHGDDALLKTVIDETIKEVNKKARKGIIKVLETTRHLIDGRTLIELGIEIKSERFGEIRAVFGKTWRRIAYSRGALDQKSIDWMRKNGEL